MCHVPIYHVSCFNAMSCSNWYDCSRSVCRMCLCLCSCLCWYVYAINNQTKLSYNSSSTVYAQLISSCFAYWFIDDTVFLISFFFHLFPFRLLNDVDVFHRHSRFDLFAYKQHEIAQYWLLVLKLGFWYVSRGESGRILYTLGWTNIHTILYRYTGMLTY